MDRGKWTPGPWRVSTRANSDRLGICGLVDTVPVMIAGTWLRPTVGEDTIPVPRAAWERLRATVRACDGATSYMAWVTRYMDASFEMLEAARAVVGERKEEG